MQETKLSLSIHTWACLVALLLVFSLHRCLTKEALCLLVKGINANMQRISAIWRSFINFVVEIRWSFKCMLQYQSFLLHIVPLYEIHTYMVKYSKGVPIEELLILNRKRLTIPPPLKFSSEKKKLSGITCPIDGEGPPSTPPEHTHTHKCFLKPFGIIHYFSKLLMNNWLFLHMHTKVVRKDNIAIYAWGIRHQPPPHHHLVKILG